MDGPEHQEPPFDHRWLDALAELCATVGNGGGPRLVDLYLERRLDVRVVAVDGRQQIEDCSSEGMALRWRLPTRRVLHAHTGISPAVVERLFSTYGARPGHIAPRPVPPADLDPPRGWREWACDLVGRLGSTRSSVRFMDRRAVVIRPHTWSTVVSPPLIRVRLGGDTSASLLAVWDHPSTPRWIRELKELPAPKRWRPTSGTHLPVLFGAGTAGVLVHELLGHLVESDLAVSRRTPLSRLHGVATTTSSFTLVDDPTRFDLPGAFSCDDEGVSARPLEIVRDGTLVSWLCDRDGADRLGAEPGRGRRSAWTRPPTPRLSNLLLTPGDTSPEDMERSLQNGLLVTRVAGATVDPHASRTVVRVERGWEVVRGRRRRPLDSCALTGGVLEVLGQIDPHLGSDATPDWRLGWCVKEGQPLPTGSIAPSVLVHRLEVI